MASSNPHWSLLPIDTTMHESAPTRSSVQSRFSSSAWPKEVVPLWHPALTTGPRASNVRACAALVRILHLSFRARAGGVGGEPFQTTLSDSPRHFGPVACLTCAGGLPARTLRKVLMSIFLASLLVTKRPSAGS